MGLTRVEVIVSISKLQKKEKYKTYKENKTMIFLSRFLLTQDEHEKKSNGFKSRIY